MATWRWQPSGAFAELLAQPTTEPESPSLDHSERGPGHDTPPDNGPDIVVPAVALEPNELAAPTPPEPIADAQGEHPETSSATDATSAARSNKPKKPGLNIPAGGDFGPWLSKAIRECDGPVRTSLLVSLCSHRAFRQQCANSSAELRVMVDASAAVYDALFLDSPPTVAPSGGHGTPPQHDGRDTLREGLANVCEGSMDLVRLWPQAARERLFELASDFELQNSLYPNGAQIFHDSPKQLGRVNLARICDALAAGDDTAAKSQIAELKSKAGAPGLLPLLSEALDGQRFGNLVVLSYGGATSRGADPRAPKRHSGFCLESQRDVWIRSGETHESPAFEHYSQLHRRALIPSVVGLYTFGVTRSRKPYLSVLRKGISLQRRVEHSWGLSREWALRFATDLTLLASALCRAGIRLPDLDARRFEVDEAQRLWLSDLWGGELMDPRAQDPAAVGICRDSIVGLLCSQPGFSLPNDWREVICHSADFETLVATLRTLEKSRHWSS